MRITIRQMSITMFIIGTFVTINHITSTFNYYNDRYTSVVSGRCPLFANVQELASVANFKNKKVDQLIDLIRNISVFNVDALAEADFPLLVKTLGKEVRVNASYAQKSRIHELNRTETPNYVLFHHGIQHYSLYNPDDPAIDGLLRDMASLKIKSAEMIRHGTQLKLLVRFSNDGEAILKFMRLRKDHETSSDMYPVNDFERHYAEIAAYHLSSIYTERYFITSVIVNNQSTAEKGIGMFRTLQRTLGFYFVPPVTGRLIDLETQIRPLAERNLNKTFYISPAGNLCFYGKCEHGCEQGNAFCGNGTLIEASLMAKLPEPDFLPVGFIWNPYVGYYKVGALPMYARLNNYCQVHVLPHSPFNTEDLLLKLIDIHIFDFLQDNLDRHSFEFFHQNKKNLGFYNLIDNGRAFGKKLTDNVGILAPLRQCCKIRDSTLKKFVNLYLGPRSLSHYLDQSMKSDPLYPVLTDGHLTAVDRRATIVLRTIMECVEDGHKLEDIVVFTSH